PATDRFPSAPRAPARSASSHARERALHVARAPVSDGLSRRGWQARRLNLRGSSSRARFFRVHQGVSMATLRKSNAATIASSEFGTRPRVCHKRRELRWCIFDLLFPHHLPPEETQWTRHLDLEAYRCHSTR